MEIIMQATKTNDFKEIKINEELFNQKPDK